MRTLGIDVSVFQGVIDWYKVKSCGIKFAMLRGGYGRNGLDERFINNYLQAKSNDMPIGVYHYSYADTAAKAKQEANFVISYLKDKKFEYPIAYDIEDKSLMSLSKSTLTNIVKTFCDTLEKAGYYVVVYSSKSWFETKLDMSKLKKYDIWVAQWNSTCTYKGEYGMWQFSDKGACHGISGFVDTDYAYKDYPSIIKKAKLNGYSTTEPKPKKVELGLKLKLSYTPLYASSTTGKLSGHLSGTYYIYDGKLVNGRYRITNQKTNCNKTPTSKYVTGWINKEDVSNGA